MGNRQTKCLKKKEIQLLLKKTHFDELELHQLYRHFAVCGHMRSE